MPEWKWCPGCGEMWLAADRGRNAAYCSRPCGQRIVNRLQRNAMTALRRRHLKEYAQLLADEHACHIAGPWRPRRPGRPPGQMTEEGP